MKGSLLLDTCAVIWIANKEPVTEELLDRLQHSEIAGQPIFVSPASAWEIGMLASRGRISLPTTPERWFASLLEASTLRLVSLPSHVLIASSFLPGNPPNDPVDRIFAATAREFGHTLVTRDQPLLDYAAQGHLHALAC
jgi:PIN domain nuclease of toxin-antitoxin system